MKKRASGRLRTGPKLFDFCVGFAVFLGILHFALRGAIFMLDKPAPDCIIYYIGFTTINL